MFYQRSKLLSANLVRIETWRLVDLLRMPTSSMEIKNSTSNLNYSSLVDNDPQEYPLGGSILLAVSSFVSVLINCIFIFAGIKTRKLEFQKLAVLMILCSDGVLGISTLYFGVVTMIEDFTDQTSLCLVQSFATAFCGIINHCFVLLVCIQRLIAVQSLNFSSTKKVFSSRKYSIVCSVAISVLFYSTAVTFLTPYDLEIKNCRIGTLYGNYFGYYFCLVFGVLTAMMVLVIILTVLVGYLLWKVFFKNSINPDTNRNSNPETSKATIKFRKYDIFVTDIENQSNSQDDIVIEINETPAHERNDKTSVAISLGDVHFDDITEDRLFTRRTIETLQTTNTENLESTPNKQSHIKNTNMGRTNLTELEERKRWETRAFCTCVIITTCTILFRIPITVSFWIEFISGVLPSPETRTIFGVIYLTNLFVDPFVYAWRIPEIRSYLRQTFLQCKAGSTG